MTMKRNKLMTGLALICLSLLSFTSKFGGEGFEVFLNDKLILQRFGTDMNKVQPIVLPQGSETDQLLIRYHHCGKTGRNRTLTVKDGEDRVLRVFNYKDNTDAAASMSCKLTALFSLQRGTAGNLKLYYASSELPGGRLLASLQFTKNNPARP
jgi:hypothetical protein